MRILVKRSNIVLRYLQKEAKQINKPRSPLVFVWFTSYGGKDLRIEFHINYDFLEEDNYDYVLNTFTGIDGRLVVADILMPNGNLCFSYVLSRGNGEILSFPGLIQKLLDFIGKRNELALKQLIELNPSDYPLLTRKKLLELLKKRDREIKKLQSKFNRPERFKFYQKQTNDYLVQMAIKVTKVKQIVTGTGIMGLVTIDKDDYKLMGRTNLINRILDWEEKNYYPKAIHQVCANLLEAQRVRIKYLEEIYRDEYNKNLGLKEKIKSLVITLRSGRR